MDGSIYSQVKAIIADRIEAGEQVVVDWLTHEIVRGKELIDTPDSDFFRACAYVHVKDVVKRVVGKYDSGPASDAQYVLEGFQHLQKAYTVQRQGQNILVPVDQLSIEEIEARADEYDTMAAGCVAHAKELRFFALSLSGQVVA
jgi:hypothetical protein